MVLGSTFIDLHLGVAQWREEWITRRNIRQKGVWDSKLQRETLVLRDGRHLSYFLDGPLLRKDCPYIFAFHAMFLTANSFLLTDPPSDYILVGANRPGYFGSDAALDSCSLETFASDMEQLADHLEIQHFYVAGHSSGGPCALACASHLPHRVLGIGLLSADPEYAHLAAPNKKWVNRICIGTCLPLCLERFLCCLPLPSSRALRNDYRLDTSLYTFDVETVRQPVLIYVGEDDAVLPVSVSRHVQTRLHKAHLEVIPKIGHLGLLRDPVLRDFFESLLSLPEKEKTSLEEGLDTSLGSLEGHSLSVHKRTRAID
jgi:pimeloyl-ACP methyl ester carboxylesterase